jgi:hypothetical protein
MMGESETTVPAKVTDKFPSVLLPTDQVLEFLEQEKDEELIKLAFVEDGRIVSFFAGKDKSYHVCGFLTTQHPDTHAGKKH